MTRIRTETRVCDHCGTKLHAGPLFGDRGFPGWSTRYLFHSEKYSGRQFDLCPTCSQELRKRQYELDERFITEDIR